MNANQVAKARKQNPYPFYALDQILTTCVSAANEHKLERFAVSIKDIPAVSEYHNVSWIIHELNDWALESMAIPVHGWLAVDCGHVDYVLFVRRPKPADDDLMLYSAKDRQPYYAFVNSVGNVELNSAVSITAE